MMMTRRSGFLLLTLMAALIALGRVHTYWEPFECDITSYAVYGHEFLRGRPLFTDLWMNAPVVWTFALAEKITGYGETEIFLINLSAALAILAGVWAAGRRGKSFAAGLWAAAFWTLIAGDLHLQANQPNLEILMNAFFAAGFTVVLGLEQTSAFAWPLTAGLLLGAAAFYKQNGATVLLALSAAHVWTSRRRRRAGLEVVFMLSGAALLWAAAFLYVLIHHTVHEAYLCNFQQTLSYGNLHRTLWKNLLQPLDPEVILRHWHQGIYRSFIPLGALAVWGVLGRVRRGGPLDRAWSLWLAYGLGVYFSITLPGWESPHYYQLLMPWLCIGAGWAAAEGSRAARWSGALALACLLALEAPFYLLTPDEWSYRKYGKMFIVTRDVARDLGVEMAPGESLYNWGYETGFYFYSRTSPPVGVIFNQLLFIPPLDKLLSDRTLRQLEAARPKFIVTFTGYLQEPAGSHPVARWFLERYEPLQSRSKGPLLILVRKGGVRG